MAFSTAVAQARRSILLLFIMIFAAPLIFLGWSTAYALVLSLSVMTIALAFGIQSRRCTQSQVTRASFVEINLLGLVISACLSALYALGMADGITDRTLARSELTNINSSVPDTIRTNISYLQVAATAALIAWSRRQRRLTPLVIGVSFACYLLSSSGTRFLFLLAISPLIYSVLLRSRTGVKVYTLAILLLFSVYIARLRSTTLLSGEALLYFDLPSTASYMAISQFSPEITNIWYFFVGNVIVLIPRALFPGKPNDEITFEFIVSVIGSEAFDGGATYLPGFLGSAWLYGGFLGVLLLSLALGLVLARAISYSVCDWQTEAKASLLLVGAILQFRNISVFYLLPFFYLAAALKIWSALRRIRGES